MQKYLYMIRTWRKQEGMSPGWLYLSTGKSGQRHWTRKPDDIGSWPEEIARTIAARVEGADVERCPYPVAELPEDTGARTFAVWVIYAAHNKGADVEGHPVMILPFNAKEQAEKIAISVKEENDADVWIAREKWDIERIKTFG